MGRMPEPPPYSRPGDVKAVTIEGNYFKEDTLELNPHDPFEKVLIAIVETNRRKRADYADPKDVFSNFKFTSDVLGVGHPEWSAVFNVAQKLSRLSNLKRNEREPQNEAIEDTFLDMAVYAIIAYAIYKERTFHEDAKRESGNTC